MGALISSAVALAEHAAAKRGRQAVERTASAAGFVAVAAACAVAAIACALAALWIYAAARVGPALAPLIVAGVLIVMCLAALAAKRSTAKRLVPLPATALTPAVLHAGAMRLLREQKGATLTAAVLAGLVAGMGEK